MPQLMTQVCDGNRLIVVANIQRFIVLTTLGFIKKNLHNLSQLRTLKISPCIASQYVARFRLFMEARIKIS